MPQNHLTLTRQSLYDLVWSRPMSDLAKDFGISDVGLAKRCRAVDVPIPYRGYWARVASGQTPPKTPLPKYRTRTPAMTSATSTTASRSMPKQIVREGEEPAVRFGLPTGPASQKSSPDAASSTLLQRLECLNLTPAVVIADTCAAVRRTAKHEKHPDRASLRLSAGEREGLLIEIHVSKVSLNRALLLADRFIKTAQAVGWPLTDPAPPEPSYTGDYRSPVVRDDVPPPPQFARLLVDGEPIAFLIEERWREEPRVPTAAELAREKRELFRYHAPRTTSIATGALRIVRIGSIHHWDLRRRTWYDHGKQLVEQKLPQVLTAFHELAQAIKEKRARDEEERRQREVQERLRREREERRQAHAKLAAEFERQAEAWNRAHFLRRYLEAARQALNDPGMTATPCESRDGFLDWATQYVDRLDPLSSRTMSLARDAHLTENQALGDQALKTLLSCVAGDNVSAQSSANEIPVDEDDSDTMDDEFDE